MKKIVSSILMFALLISVFQLTVVAKDFPDTSGKHFDEEVSLLTDLGIISGRENGNFDPEGKLTRAEMAAIIVRLYNMESTASGTDVFGDVPSTHWAYKFIGTAYQLGIINGVGNGRFDPDGNLTYSQAIKMLVSTLGYSVEAETKGGYPSGYLAKASELGILKGVSLNSNEEMTRSNMAILVANSLDCDILVRSKFGNSYEFGVKKDATLLSEYKSIYVFEGRITDTFYDKFTGAISIKEGEVALDAIKKFAVGDTKAESYLGFKVKLYAYNDGTDTYTIKSISKKQGSEVVELSASDLLASSTDSTLCYEKNGKRTKLSIASNALFMHNGSKTLLFLVPTEGTLKAILDDGTEVNAVITEKFDNFVVKRADAAKNMIYFKNVLPGQDNELEIIKDSGSKVNFVNSDGSEAKVSDCNEWDIISVTKSDDGRYVKAVRSSTSVTGTIAEINDKGVLIDKIEYKISEGLTKNFKLDQPKLGLEAEYKLDFTGEIAAVLIGKSQSEYGYIMGAYMSGTSLEQKTYIKLLTQKKEYKIFGTTEKVEITNGINSSRNVDGDKVLNQQYGLTKDGETVIEQLIRYRTSEDGKYISAIEIAAISADNPNVINRETRSTYFTMDHYQPTPTRYYGDPMNTFLAKYYIPKDCLIFNVPETHASDEEAYSIISIDNFEHSVDYSKFRLYDMNAANAATAMTITLTEVGDSKINNDSPTGLVTGVAKGMTKDDEIVTKVYVTSLGKTYALYGDELIKAKFGTKGQASTVITDPTKESPSVLTNDGKLKDEIDLMDLKPGDIIQYEVTDDRFVAVSVRFRAESPLKKELGVNNDVESPTNANGNYAKILYWFNEITYSDGRCILNHFNVNGVEWERIEAFGYASIIEFDMKTKTTTFVKASTIGEGDLIFSHRRSNSPKQFIKYVNMDEE